MYCDIPKGLLEYHPPANLLDESKERKTSIASMNTVRVNICYRPLRIGWAIRAGDLLAFRQAVRLSHTMWGGRFNPIIVMDNEEEAKRLVDLFRVDLLWPIGGTEDTKSFLKKFPYLINPFIPGPLFVGNKTEQKRAQLLDVHNALIYLRDRPEWKAICESGARVYTWQPDEPLADIFLVRFGAYPDPKEIGTDYLEMFVSATDAKEYRLESEVPIPSDVLDHPSIPYLSRHGINQHHSVRNSRDSPGFFVGNASNFDDLVCHWNLRAANIEALFVDPNHLPRYASVIPAWDKFVRERVASRRESDRHVAVWFRHDVFAPLDDKLLNEIRKPFGDMRLSMCPVSESLWNGRNVRAPMMYLGETSVLGVMTNETGKPKMSFALSEKPFSSDNWFHTQHLVASLSFSGALYGDEQHTLKPPYLPELNEFYARAMHFHYDRLRVEPERIGVVIDTLDHDSFLFALPVANLMERLFDMAGFSSNLSSGGLITKQLISRLGGINWGRPFKIPGVRRLLKTYGPTKAFTKRSALQLIGKEDPDRCGKPGGKFSEYADLFIERRPYDSKLTPPDVFAYLVDKGLFRIGAELTCPNCRMTSWISLDSLKQKIVCELCGQEHDSTRQLVNGEWHYRRTGILGTEKNAQGAVPVILTLQQLQRTIEGAGGGGVYSPSLDLIPKDGKDLPKCEIDFVWIIPRVYPQKTVVILAECKDQLPIDGNDIENLRRVAEAFPRKRFKTFVLLTRLRPFTTQEIKLALTLTTNLDSGPSC